MKTIWTTLFFITVIICEGQNLVLNPGFEDTVRCPYGQADMAACRYWSEYNVSTPDYFHPCSSDNIIKPPSTAFGYQMPYEGNAYAGFYTYQKDIVPFRELISGTLSSPLQIGTEYFVSFYTSKGFVPFGYSVSTNMLGALFTTTSFSGALPSSVGNFAHVYTDSIISDTLNWVQISGSFIADSNYTHVAFGNFFDDQHTDTVMFDSGWRAYYFIDNVCVSTNPATCNITVGVNEANQNASVRLFPNPFSNQLTFSLADNEPTTVTLYNFLAQQVLQQTFANSTTINTAQLADGIYFYELRNDKGILKTGKAVKQ